MSMFKLVWIYTIIYVEKIMKDINETQRSCIRFFCYKGDKSGKKRVY